MGPQKEAEVLDGSGAGLPSSSSAAFGSQYQCLPKEADQSGVVVWSQQDGEQESGMVVIPGVSPVQENAGGAWGGHPVRENEAA